MPSQSLKNLRADQIIGNFLVFRRNAEGEPFGPASYSGHYVGAKHAAGAQQDPTSWGIWLAGPDGKAQGEEFRGP